MSPDFYQGQLLPQDLYFSGVQVSIAGEMALLQNLRVYTVIILLDLRVNFAWHLSHHQHL